MQQPPAIQQQQQQQPKQERKSNMDLLGDISGDFFAPSSTTAAPTQNTGGIEHNFFDQAILIVLTVIYSFYLCIV